MSSSCLVLSCEQRVVSSLKSQVDALRRRNTALRLLNQGLVVGSYATAPNSAGRDYIAEREAEFYKGSNDEYLPPRQ